MRRLILQDQTVNAHCKSSVQYYRRCVVTVKHPVLDVNVIVDDSATALAADT